MKKLFGGINLTWKKLILFAIIAGIYTAIMAMIPITKDTSFRDISIQFEWWILFGIIIISNSKSPKDSALKCFVFFLISQPLIYLFQVPFSHMGWKLFMYYKTWFIWTLLTIPMGFIGYYIKKKNWISTIILIPMLIFLSFLGLGYLDSCIDSFPHHLLSFISCFTMIVIIVLNLFDKLKLRLICFGVTLLFIITYIILNSSFVNTEFEVYRSLSEFDITTSGEASVTFFSATKKGNVELIPYEDNYNLKLMGKKGGKYNFEITDDNSTYSFEYYFDKEQNSVILNKK